jgi:cobalt-zinc-cadmium efflux system membrane fusion protein
MTARRSLMGGFRLRTPAVIGAILVAALGCSPSDHAEEQGETEHAEHASGRDEHTHQDEAPGSDHSGEAHDEHEPGGGDRVVLTPEAIEASGIVVELATSREIARVIDLPGEDIVPRFPGIAKEVRKNLGDVVRQGEVLAVIESNESLALYEVTSLISGTIIEKHITLGEFVRDDSDIYVVADLSSVWVNVTVYARDIERVRRGQAVRVIGVGGGPEVRGTIDYIGPVIGEITRAATARVVLPNRDRAWRPGLFVTARVEMERETVAVGVPDGAVQRVEGKDVVFLQDEEGFVPREVRLGRTDGEWTEVLAGLEPGERYAAAGGFILKSELMKSEAGHDH